MFFTSHSAKIRVVTTEADRGNVSVVLSQDGNTFTTLEIPDSNLGDLIGVWERVRENVYTIRSYQCVSASLGSGQKCVVGGESKCGDSTSVTKQECLRTWEKER